MIPLWNAAAVLPAIRPGQPGHSPDRSPYRVPMAEFVERFGSSKERIAILRGLIAYRTALAQSAIISGFQWLDGSFLENKELLEGAPPKDVDVVTFYLLPAGHSQSDLMGAYPDLFDHEFVKKTYLVDEYTYQIGLELGRFDVRQISYWSSMWSHRRTGLWKGFVQVDLSAAQDTIATSLLNQIEKEGAVK